MGYRIRVISPDGRYGIFCAMLDQDFAITLVTERLAQRLRLKRQGVSVAISGIGGASVSTRHAVHVNVATRYKRGPLYSTSALVLKSLTEYVPPRSHNTSHFGLSPRVKPCRSESCKFRWHRYIDWSRSVRRCFVEWGAETFS